MLITFSAYGMLRDSVNVLLEGGPSHINIEEIQAAILAFEGVNAVHKLHVWNINIQQALLTAHIQVKLEAYSGDILN